MLRSSLSQGAIGGGLGAASAFVTGGNVLEGAAWGLGTGLATGLYGGYRAVKRSAKSTPKPAPKAQEETVNDEIIAVTNSDEQQRQARTYVNESAQAGLSKEQIIKGLQEQGIQVLQNTIKIKTVNKTMHYDISGAEHKGVPTPHVQQSIINVNPKTGQIFINKDNTWVRPMNQQDVRIIRNYLKRK